MASTAKGIKTETKPTAGYAATIKAVDALLSVSREKVRRVETVHCSQVDANPHFSIWNRLGPQKLALCLLLRSQLSPTGRCAHRKAV